MTRKTGGVMNMRYRFDHMEFAGSLGDLVTLLPLVIGIIF